MALNNEQNFTFYLIYFSINTLQYIWKDIVKMGLREIRCGIWTGFIWLRIQTNDFNEASGSITF
jgi:hypothetical protein